MPPIADLLVAAGVVAVQDGAVLIVREKGCWGLPKGCREPGESLADTARREAQEEAGVEVEVGDVAYVIEYLEVDGRSRTLQVFFEARPTSGDPHPSDPDGEVEEARWVPFGDVESLLAPHHSRALVHWRSGLRGAYHFVDRFRGPVRVT